MKRLNKKKAASRRDFIRLTGKVALASTLVGCVDANTNEQDRAGGGRTEAKVSAGGPEPPANQEYPTEKLGEIASSAPSPPFSLQVRNPRWCPDTQKQGAVKFFQEETLWAEKGTGNLAHFPVPNDFVEPCPEFNVPTTDPDFYTKREDWHNQWKQFNELLFGFKLQMPQNPTADDPDFFAFLTALADQARRYNAALYWLRRLHFYKKGLGKDYPPFNPHGDELKDGIDPTNSEFQGLVTRAEDRWQTTIDDMNKLLNGHDSSLVHGFKYTRADMVEVNGYIISMRVVSQKAALLKKHGKEIGGSSSSHISISSAFSSH